RVASHQQVGGSLACCIGTIWTQWRFFRKRARWPEAAVDLVRRNLYEALHPAGAGHVQQHLRSDDIGADERGRVQDAAIHVAFGGEMDDRMHTVAKGGLDGSPIGDVPAKELVTRLLAKVGKVVEVAGVRQGVEIDDLDLRLGFQEVVNEVAADKAAAA